MGGAYKLYQKNVSEVLHQHRGIKGSVSSEVPNTQKKGCRPSAFVVSIHEAHTFNDYDVQQVPSLKKFEAQN